MTKSEIEGKVIDIVCKQMGAEKANVKRETNFQADLNADSLDTVELVMEFEDEFGTSIPDEQAEKITTVGQAIDFICQAKGQLLMVQACAHLKAQGAEFHLTVVGDGPDRQRLQQAVQDARLSDCVTFTGALNTAEVHRQLQQTDAFVLPSLAEGIPVVLMEAMASGVPCVTTPVNGIPELVRHDVNGLLATPGDVDALSTQLGRMVADGELRARLGQAARQTVCDQYDTHRNVEGLSQLFTSIEWRCDGAEPVLALRAEG